MFNRSATSASSSLCLLRRLSVPALLCPDILSLARQALASLAPPAWHSLPGRHWLLGRHVLLRQQVSPKSGMHAGRIEDLGLHQRRRLVVYRPVIPGTADRHASGIEIPEAKNIFSAYHLQALLTIVLVVEPGRLDPVEDL